MKFDFIVLNKMKIERMFLIVCIFATVLVGLWLILNIIEPEQKIVVINQMNINPALNAQNVQGADKKQNEPSLEEKALISNQKYFTIEDNRNEDLRNLKKTTKNWKGSVDGIDFEGRDERIFGSEEFFLYGNVDN